MRSFFARRTSYIPLFLICFFAFLMHQKTLATHAAGGSIEYKCVGQDSFLLTAKFIQDCANGVSSTITALTVTAVSSCGTTIFLLPNVSMVEISSICSSQLNQTTCNGGTLPGFELATFSDTVSLPASCTNWEFYYNISARNSSINTQGGNFYVKSFMDNQNFPCNNSPRISNNYVQQLCNGQSHTIDFAVADPDCDSLQFEFDTARASTFFNTTYSNPYTPQQPMTGIQIDPATGIISVTATGMPLGNYIVVVRANEYERGTGILKGYVTHDIQFTIITCSNAAPIATSSIANLSGTAMLLDSNTIEVCPGGNFCFDLTFADLDSTGLNPDTLLITSGLAALIPGATITTTGTNPVVATICASNVNLPCNDIFAVMAFDNSCPISLLHVEAITIKMGSELQASGGSTCPGIPQPLSVTGRSNVNWSVLTGDSITPSNFSCTTCVNPTATPMITTIYIVTTSDPLCITADTVTVTVESLTIDSLLVTNPTCALPNSGQIQVVTTYSVFAPIQFSIGGALQANAIFTGLSAGNYTVLATDTLLGCFDTTQVALFGLLNPLNISVSNDTTIHLGDTINLCASTNGGTGSVQYIWNSGATTNCTSVSPTSTVDFIVTATDSCGVVAADTILVTVIPPLAISQNLTPESIVQIFPNPYQGQVNIQLQLTEVAEVQVEILDIVGKKVLELENRNLSKGSHQYQFSAKARGLNTGIYLVRTTINGRQQVRKIIEF